MLRSQLQLQKTESLESEKAAFEQLVSVGLVSLELLTTGDAGLELVLAPLHLLFLA